MSIGEVRNGSSQRAATANAPSEAFYRNGSAREEITLLPNRAGLDSVTEVVLLIERCLEKQRKSAAERRDAAESAQARREQQAVAKIREEADDAFKQAIVSGVTSMAVGAVQVTGAGMNLHSTGVEAQAQKAKDAASKLDEGIDGTQRALKMKHATDLSHRAARLSAEGKAIAEGGKVLEGCGKLADAPLGQHVKLRQAEQAEAKNAAEAFGRHARREDEAASEANELRQKTFDRLEQLLQAEQQSRLALIQRA